MKEIIENVFNLIPGTYFVGIFEEGGLVIESSSRVQELDVEVAAGVSQRIIQAIRKGIEMRSKKAYGDFEEALIYTQNSLIYILCIGENHYGMVGIFNRETPIGRVKTVLRNQAELLKSL